MADILSGESEDEVSKCKSHSAKKQRLESSSSSDAEQKLLPDNEHTPNSCTDTNVTSRSSERIRRKRSKSFTMPSKQELWDAIPSTKTPEKTYDELKPRKLVNNFTRVTHRYNHDPVYTSDEDSSLGGFLAEDGSESTSDSSDSDFLEENVLQNEIRQRRKKHRIKNRRLVQVSSDSDSVPPPSDSQGNKLRSRLREKILSRCNSVDETNSGQNLERELSPAKDELILGLKKAKALLASSSDDEKPVVKNPKEDKPVSVRRPIRDKRGRKRRTNACAMGKPSDADDEECTSMSDKSVINSVCEDAGVVNGCGDKMASRSRVSDDSVDSDSEEIGSAPKRRRGCALDSESQTGSSSSDDQDADNEECLSRSLLQSQERKQKRESLFRDFKQARSKLESKQTVT